MASSINRQVAQALLKRLKAKETKHNEAVRLAELIARFQRVGGRPTPEVQPDPLPEDKPTVVSEDDPLSGLK